MTTQSTRAPGFYWVQFRAHNGLFDWTVALWAVTTSGRGYWLVPGIEDEWTDSDDDIAAVDERQLIHVDEGGR